MRSKNGFTLIELMIVVVIIGILAAIAIPKFNSISRASKEAEAQGILKQIYTLEERHRQKTDAYTTTIADLEGGVLVGSQARYYDFSLGAHGSGFCATATPSAPDGVNAGVTAQSMDANRVLYRAANCP